MNRKRVFPRVLLLVLLHSASVAAQSATSAKTLPDAPKAAAPAAATAAREFKGEVYLGIGYANLDVAGLQSRQHGWGWGASVAWRPRRHFALVADFSGQYEPECAENDVKCFLRLISSRQIREFSAYQFLAGPRVILPARRAEVFFHALAGGARTHSSILDLTTGAQTKVSSGPHLALAFGGGVDWNFAERFAVRLAQVDVIPVRENAQWQKNVRIQGGIVFRF
jgi:hypothetical protein